jgi:23S rRNA pseudouridine1911/1915/1917 synthase
LTKNRKRELKVLFLDNHLIAVYKDFGVLAQADEPGGDSLIEQTKTYLKVEFNKPGNVFLGLVHRLDRPVAGVMVFARTSKAASRLSQQFRERTPEKRYRAVVQGIPDETSATLVHFLRKEKSLKATVFPRSAPESKRAELSYSLESVVHSNAILGIQLKTGRFHQIRSQLAFIGHPILGDIKYGAEHSLPEQKIALYASSITFEHPITKEKMTVESPVPAGWPLFGS